VADEIEMETAVNFGGKYKSPFVRSSKCETCTNTYLTYIIYEGVWRVEISGACL
jgi:hypothetical protein